MNERIFELAKQADLIQWDTLPSGARTPDHESVVKARKFAELMVAECVGIVENLSPGYKDYRDQIEDVFRRDCVIEIVKHFGVAL